MAVQTIELNLSIVREQVKTLCIGPGRLKFERAIRGSDTIYA